MAWRFTGTKNGDQWRLALSLQTLATQVDELWPDRGRASDGTVASATHSTQNPTSDHEPAKPPVGVVAAIDITHDPETGADMGALAESVRLSRDPRVKYLIFNRQMFSSYPIVDEAGSVLYQPYEWRPYYGTNPHTSHVHLSVLADPALYDDDSRWEIGGPMAVFKDGDNGRVIRLLQVTYNRWDADRGIGQIITEDGVWGPNTSAAMSRVQADLGVAQTGQPTDLVLWELGAVRAYPSHPWSVFAHTHPEIDTEIQGVADALNDHGHEIPAGKTGPALQVQ